MAHMHKNKQFAYKRKKAKPVLKQNLNVLIERNV